MLNDDVKWELIILSDVFEITSTKSGIDKNKIKNIELQGNNPYITRTDRNNGFDLFITEQDYELNEGNVISIGLDTQTVFYQPHSFYTGQNIQILNNEHLNKYNSLFLVTLLKIVLEKFNWGGNGATLTRLKNSRILLPVNSNNEPDYEFMTDFMKEIEKQQISKYEDHLSNLKYSNWGAISNLNSVKWKEFNLHDLFTNIQRGKRLIRTNFLEGNIPFISSSSLSNGLDSFIGNSENIRNFNNCLTLANSGSVGSTFYHPYDFVASDHVTHLKNEDFNKYVYLFIATMTKRLSEKYNFNREINDQRLKRETIILPVDDEGNPDYEYMEQYMINIEIQFLEKYLNYIKNN